MNIEALTDIGVNIPDISKGREFTLGLLAGLVIHVSHNHLRAIGQIAFGDGVAYAPCCAGDDGCLA